MTIAPDTGENEQLGPSEHQRRRCPENALTDITDLFTAAKKQEKTVYVFCSKDLLAILDFILIYFWTKNSFADISI